MNEDCLSFLKCYTEESERLIYHYTNGITAIDKILSKGKLRLGPMMNTNDPRENRNWSFVAEGNANTQHSDEAFFQVQNALNSAFKRESKVASFSMDDHENALALPKEIFYRGYARSRMWSQYGNQHKGICLVFSVESLVEGLKMVAEDSRYVWTGPVKYENNIMCPPFSWSRVEKVGIDSYADDFLCKYGDVFHFQKLEDYRDEHEFRLVARLKSDEWLFIDISKIPSSSNSWSRFSIRLDTRSHSSRR
ncbi:MAG: DUF2971 domain-containing protein [Planctomycetes bacterium]|nr:DUF2971 domain-containing protein [Planctomycetota bacterium]